MSATHHDGVVFFSYRTWTGKTETGSYEETGGTGKKCGSKFIRVNADPFADYLVGK